MLWDSIYWKKLSNWYVQQDLRHEFSSWKFGIIWNCFYIVFNGRCLFCIIFRQLWWIFSTSYSVWKILETCILLLKMSTKKSHNRPRSKGDHDRCKSCGKSKKEFNSIEVDSDDCDGCNAAGNQMEDRTEQVQSLFYH